MNALQFREIAKLLNRAEELEGESHHIFDHVLTNLAFSNLSSKTRHEFIKSTYPAVDMHAEAQENIRKAVEILRDLIHSPTIQKN